MLDYELLELSYLHRKNVRICLEVMNVMEWALRQMQLDARKKVTQPHLLLFHRITSLYSDIANMQVITFTVTVCLLCLEMFCLGYSVLTKKLSY